MVVIIKRLLMCLMFIICTMWLTSCEMMDQTYKIKNFFSDSVLSYGRINGLPRPVDATYVKATSADRIEYKTTKDGFNKNVSKIYEFLKSRNFKYLGTQGEVLSTFFGGAPDYAFYECDNLSDFRKINDDGKINDNYYTFVWADNLGEGTYLDKDCTLEIIGREENQNEMYVVVEITGGWVLTSHFYKEYKTLPLGYLCPWLRENHLNNITEIRIETTTVDARVGSLKEIAYSENEKHISHNMLSPYIKAIEVNCEDEISPYSPKVTYQLTNDSGETFQLTIVNNLVCVNGKYYQIDYLIDNRNAELVCHSLVSNINEFIIYTNDDNNEYVMEYEEFLTLEFIEYKYDVLEEETLYYILTDFGKVYIHDETTIYFFDEELQYYVYYEIISDSNFSSLFIS